MPETELRLSTTELRDLREVQKALSAYEIYYCIYLNMLEVEDSEKDEKERRSVAEKHKIIVESFFEERIKPVVKEDGTLEEKVPSEVEMYFSRVLSSARGIDGVR